jgi:aerobic-type carbon monoxide dehydrogenase small subunit (CoxS/CutS family)
MDQYLNIEINGNRYQVPAGINLAAALWYLGWRTFNRNMNGSPRAINCGMGICFDCLVKVDGRSNVRACITTVRQEMRVELLPSELEVSLEN